MTRDAALVTWLFRAGVGSSSRRKKGFKLRTTGLSKLRYESYPVTVSVMLAAIQASNSMPTELLNVAALAGRVLLELVL